MKISVPSCTYSLLTRGGAVAPSPPSPLLSQPHFYFFSHSQLECRLMIRNLV